MSLSTPGSAQLVAVQRATAIVAAEGLPEALAEAFAMHGIESLRVSLDEVVAQIGTGGADLVVLDASPDAVRVCGRVKGNARTHFVPIVILGGDADARRRAYAAGADHVVVEPLDAEEVIARVWSLLRTFRIFKSFEGKRQDLKLRRDWIRYLVHDLGNTLAKVVYNVLYLRRRLGDTDTDALDALGELERSVERSVGMLRDLLDVDRLRQGRLPVRLEPVAVLDVVRQTGQRLRAFAAEHHAGLRIVGEEIVATGDRMLVERVVTNLLENAIRFTPPGEDVDVRVSTTDGEARVAVTNRGPAIAPGDRERIFQPFVRLDGTVHAGGAGLGLAFARVALDAQGGRIWIDDTSASGTTFAFALPMPH